MINQQLVDFIKSQLQKGSSKEIITKELLSNGWTAQDVEEGFKAVAIPIPTPNSNLVPPSPLGTNIILEPQIKYAGFWVRLGAHIIDGLVLIIPVLILIALAVFSIGVPKDLTPESINPIKNVAIAINLLVSWAYFIFMTYKYQATLGKKAVGIKVFSKDLEKPTLGKIILRETVGKYISGIIFSIGYLMITWTKKKQALHDKIAGTVVVYNDPNKKTSTGVIIIIVFFVIGLPAVLGIVSAIILGSLSHARAEADLRVKEALISTIPAATSHFEKNSSYLDFKPQISPVDCSGDPIANISPDGKQLAIFMKSCVTKTNYFCVNPVTNFTEEMANADDVYVNSGATVCYSEKDKESEDAIKYIKEDEKTELPIVKTTSKELTKIFKGGALGYEINYPDNWTYQKQEDKNTGATSVTFIRDPKNPTVGVSITKLSLGDGQSGIDKSITAVSFLIDIIKQDATNLSGDSSEVTDYSYKFSDGTTLSGKQLESWYTYKNVKYKQWDVLLTGNNFFLIRSLSDISGYEAQQETAKAMLNSLVIKK